MPSLPGGPISCGRDAGEAQDLAKANLPSIVHRNDDGRFVTDTLTIAGLVENQHKNVLELVRSYLNDFEEFGEVAFETRLNCQGS